MRSERMQVAKQLDDVSEDVREDCLTQAAIHLTVYKKLSAPEVLK
jgi:hypothetical protein